MKRQFFLLSMFALGLSLGGLSVLTWAQIDAYETHARGVLAGGRLAATGPKSGAY